MSPEQIIEVETITIEEIQLQPKVNLTEKQEKIVEEVSLSLNHCMNKDSFL